MGVTKEFIGDDAGVGYHFSDIYFGLASNMWDSLTFPGRSNVVATIGLIHAGFINALNLVGFTPVIVDRIYYFLSYFISGLGMYFLSFVICFRLFPANINKIWIPALTGAVFYMLNNFTMILLSFPPTNYMYSYMLLPWIFLLYLKDFHISIDLWKRFIFVLVFIVLLGGNPSNTIGIVALLLFYEIFFREEGKIIHNIKNFATTMAIIILFSGYIYFPILANSGNPYGLISKTDTMSSVDHNSTLTSIDNLFRFRGHPAQSDYVFNVFLLSKKIILANFLLLMLVCVSLLREKKDKFTIFFFSVILIFIFLAKSEHPPFSEINRWLYQNIPLFGMYRASYYKFIYYCIFSFSVLLSMSILRVNKKILELQTPSILRGLSRVIPLIFVLYCAGPFFSGDIVRKIHKTAIPTEYHQINQYFSNDKTDFSVLSLPQLPSGLMLDWGEGNFYGGGANPDYFLLGRPVWSNGWFLPENPTSDQFGFYKNMLSRTNIKYIFLHKDIPEKFSFGQGDRGDLDGQTNYLSMNNQLTEDKDFVLIQDNQYFKVFEIKQERFVPHLYIPEKVEISKQTINDYLENIIDDNSTIRSATYFETQFIDDIEKLKNLPSNTVDAEKLPTIEFKKINSSKYRAIIHTASEELPLIFSESFDSGWKVYLSLDFQNKAQNDNQMNGNIAETWFRKPIVNNEKHLIVNGYANSWIINPVDICKDSKVCQKNADNSYDMELIVEFWPQRMFYLGLFVSGVSVFWILLCLIYYWRKRVRSKDEEQRI